MIYYLRQSIPESPSTVMITTSFLVDLENKFLVEPAATPQVFVLRINVCVRADVVLYKTGVVIDFD